MSTSSSKRYIWDDDDADQAVEASASPNRRAMMTSIPFPRPIATASASGSSIDTYTGGQKEYASKKSRDLDDYLSQMSLSDGFPSSADPRGSHNIPVSMAEDKAAASLTALNDLKRKIEEMKTELDAKIEKSKSLYQELRRLQLAKDKRFNKYREQWKQKIDSEREDGRVALAKQQQLHEKVASDVNQLQSKLRELEDRIDAFQRHHDIILDRAHAEVTTKRLRMRKQLEIEEKTSQDKIIRSRDNALKKQVADAFAPMVDELVKLNKETLLRRKEEVEAKLNELRLDLEADADRKYADKLRRMRENADQEETRRTTAIEAAINAVIGKQDTALSHLREKFNTEVIQLEEQMEKRLHSETEHMSSAVRTIQQVEAKNIEELILYHKQEMQSTMQRCDALIVDLRKSIEVEKSSYERNQRDAERDRHLSRKQRRIHSRKLAIEAETNQLLEKVREELLRDRASIQQGIEQQVADARSHCQSKIEDLQSSLHQMSQHLSQIENDKISTETRLLSLKSSLQKKIDSANSLSKVVEVLKREKQSLETEFTPEAVVLADSQRSKRQQQWDEELSSWKQRREVAKSELNSFQCKIDETIAAKRDELAQQLNRIREKIDRLKISKAKILTDLSQQLDGVKAERSVLEERLESLREAHVANPMLTTVANESKPSFKIDRSSSRLPSQESKSKSNLRRK
jgi:hypothetical protein